MSTNVRCYYHVVYSSFVFLKCSALVRLAFNTVQLLNAVPNSQLPFS